jgi:hypothetical protein
MTDTNPSLAIEGNVLGPEWSYSDAMIRHRAELREIERLRWTAFLDGTSAPSADDLLRGAPFYKGSLSADVLRYGAGDFGDARHFTAKDKFARLGAALHALAAEKTTSTVADAVAALSEIDHPVDNDDHRLRCNLYRAYVGDVDAAMVMAVDTISAAFHQDWHLIGDPTRMVWQALGWLAFLSTKFERDERVGTNIRSMTSPFDRIESAAFEFRLQVERAIVETAVYEARNPDAA